MNPEMIKAEIRQRFGSLTEFAKVLGVSGQAVSNTIRQPCYSRRIEKEIARILGMNGQEVWPERYTLNGEYISIRKNHFQKV